MYVHVCSIVLHVHVYMQALLESGYIAWQEKQANLKDSSPVLAALMKLSDPATRGSGAEGVFLMALAGDGEKRFSQVYTHVPFRYMHTSYHMSLSERVSLSSSLAVCV